MAQRRNKTFIEINGLDDVKKVFEELAPRHARNLNRATVHGVAQVGAKELKAKVGSMSFKVNSGNLKKSIAAKRKKSHPDRPRSDVIFRSGSDQKNDGFYWRFLEHGTSKGVSGSDFVRGVRESIFARIPQIFKEQFAKKLEKALARERKKRSGAK